MTQVQARKVEEIEELPSSDRGDHGDSHEHEIRLSDGFASCSPGILIDYGADGYTF